MTRNPLFQPESAAQGFQMADVYFNLHRRVWSLKSRRTGRVESYARVVACERSARMVVGKAGNAKVCRTGQKNVHAFARTSAGIVSDDVDGWRAYLESLTGLVRITYVPTFAPYFYRCDTKEPVHAVSAIYMLAPYDAPPSVLALPK